MMTTKYSTQPYHGWWWRTLLRGALTLGIGLFLIFALGQAQRWGWFTTNEQHHDHDHAAGEDLVYICPMMCTDLRSPTPGFCPVCGMPLEPMKSGSANQDPYAAIIDPVARRLAHISTAPAQRRSISRTIQSPGALTFNESRLANIVTYSDGRIEKLYADFTGIKIAKGKKLVELFSPRLEESQVAFLEARRTLAEMRNSNLGDAVSTQQSLVEQARRQLRELGMMEAQVKELEKSGKVQSRITIHSPMAGTVIAKEVVEGEEVKRGQTLYKIADLSTVWLMIDLFPDDATLIQEGQTVEAEVRSWPGEMFRGNVTFKDPIVHPQTRTVRVRVELPNPQGKLRPGDYATAKLITKIDDSSLVVPRSALLRVGSNSVVYIETESGRFEIRPVKVKSVSEDVAVIAEPVSRAFFEFYPTLQALEIPGYLPFSTPGLTGMFPHVITQPWDTLLGGVREGEQVAVSGNFLIDSQMQLAGKPSLIDTSKVRMDLNDWKIQQELKRLSPGERDLAQHQRICPVTEAELGSMGRPIKIMINGRPVFICCESCGRPLLKKPEKYLPRIPQHKKGDH